MIKPITRLLTCGSVDDGKSTLIGRLLVENNSVPQDTIHAAIKTRRSGSTIPAGQIDFSLLTDGLEAEREQGITIDVAYRSMTLLNGGRLIISDAPGHEQYTRNMVVGASRADIGLVLVDVTKGVRTQTLRHLMICKLMGINRIIFAINKLDVVGYDKSVFEPISKILSKEMQRLSIDDGVIIPLSALVGDNVVRRTKAMSWYEGPTLQEAIQQWSSPSASTATAIMRAQWISRADGFRGIAGTVHHGSFKVGNEVTIFPSLKKASISQIINFEGNILEAGVERAVTLVLTPEVDVARGDVIAKDSEQLKATNRFVANIVWLDEEALAQNRSYMLYSGPSSSPAVITNINHRLDVNTGNRFPASSLSSNDIGEIEIATDVPLILKPYDESREFGNFILVDRMNQRTIGAGMIRYTLSRATNVYRQLFEIDKAKRSAQKNQRSFVVWLTGLSGSGKSTIANALEKTLFANEVHSYVLDGDNLRLGLNSDLGFTREDRVENVRRVAEVAKLMVDAGLVVIVAIVSPFAADRDRAKSMFEPGTFLEVYVNTPLDICQQRDPKGLYKKSSAGELPNFTGISQEYEAPKNADIVLDGTASVEENISTIVRAIL